MCKLENQQTQTKIQANKVCQYCVMLRGKQAELGRAKQRDSGWGGDEIFSDRNKTIKCPH